MSSSISKFLFRPKTIIGYLLLRNNTAVPLDGISPEELKLSAKQKIPVSKNEELRHRRTLNAIVHCLGFKGDFGDYTHHGWKEFQRFLVDNHCEKKARLFPTDFGGCIDLFFTPYDGPTRGQLAHRIFESELPVPQTVFLGFGVDWDAWDGHHQNHDMTRNYIGTPSSAYAVVGGDPKTARSRADRLFALRGSLVGQFGFLDESLVRGYLNCIEDNWSGQINGSNLQVNAISAFRNVFDFQEEGWVDLIPYSEQLVVLRAHDGSWDILWRGYRESQPPKVSDLNSSRFLALEDHPSGLLRQFDTERSEYFRKGLQEGQESQFAKREFQKHGGDLADRHLESNELLNLNCKGGHTKKQENEGSISCLLRVPEGFREVEVGEKVLAISDLITVNQFRQVLLNSGYLERRISCSEQWEFGNCLEDLKSSPVAASWADAQAYCRALENSIKAPVRLLSIREL